MTAALKDPAEPVIQKEKLEQRESNRVTSMNYLPLVAPNALIVVKNQQGGKASR
jgi:hypothetical protein